MDIKEYRFNKGIKEDVSPLYLSAFPENERPPLEYFYHSLNEYKENHLFAYYENDEFIGFSYISLYEDICYIFFLAVSPQKRNMGYGSKIIDLIKNKYKDYVLLLVYEEVDKKYDDYLFRKKREEFYTRNGFKENIFKSAE